jgi:hypothetical protein
MYIGLKAQVITLDSHASNEILKHGNRIDKPALIEMI